MDIARARTCSFDNHTWRLEALPYQNDSESVWSATPMHTRKIDATGMQWRVVLYPRIYLLRTYGTAVVYARP